MAFQRNKFYPRVLKDLVNRSTVGMYFYLVITLIVLSVNGFYKRHPGFSALFFVAMLIIAGFRIFQFYHFRRLNEFNEEFVILLLNLDTEETLNLAEQIRSEMENLRFPFEGQHISATVSLGAASCIPGKQSQKEDFLKTADEALYRAKSLGRNHVIFSDKTVNPPDPETHN